jgi:hypothetical protein
VAANISHDNEDSGINIYPGSTGCLVYDNVTYDNGDHGIDDCFAANATIVANTIYDNVTAASTSRAAPPGRRWRATSASTTASQPAPARGHQFPVAENDRGHHDELRPGQSEHD